MEKVLSKIITVIFLVSLFGLTVYFQKDIVNAINNNYVYHRNVTIPAKNNYAKNYNYDFVQITNDFYPKNKQELLNVFYTILDSGWENFHFFCDDEYSTCLKDVDKLISANSEIGHINNFVHPYNSYSSIAINYNSIGKINVNVTKLYNEEEIAKTNQKIDTIYKNIIKDTMDTTTKIKTIHDYIINNTKYFNDINSDKQVNKAIGPLFYNVAICGGYSDTMSIFLHYMNLKNYKVASENHIWNAVDINNEWFHIDLTWDDPVVNTGDNLLLHNFFLITTAELKKESDGTHTYPNNIYIEVKEKD